MTYDSLVFLLFFFAFLIFYFVIPYKIWKWLVLFVFNIAFLLLAGSKSGFLVFSVSYIWLYFVSAGIGSLYRRFEQNTENLTKKEANLVLKKYKRKTFPLVVLGITGFISALVYIKLGRLAGFPETYLSDFRFPSIIVPIGLSYYTFSSVGYLLDVYWRKTKAERNPFKLFIVMSFFPSIVQGPIGHYDKLISQLDNLPGFQYERVCYGAQRMLWGYIEKCVISERISLYTTTIFGDINSYQGIEVFLAVIGNVLQIYTDFSGCMNIVCGAAEVLGIQLDENFRQPFFALSAQEFWRRWHITLGAWFKDYVYMPMAMNKRHMAFVIRVRKKHGVRISSVASTAFPLLTVWILTGLWHGTGWSYLVWGIYWGCLILLESIFPQACVRFAQKLSVNTDSTGFRLLLMMRTFLYFAIGRMITVLGNPGGLISVAKQIVKNPKWWVLFDGSLYSHGLDQKDFYVLLFALVILWLIDYYSTKMNVREQLAVQPLPVRWFVYVFGLFFLLIFGFYGSGYNAGDFVYAGY